MPLLSAAETEPLFETLFSLFWGEFLDFYDVNIYDIGVSSHLWRERKGLESLGGPSALLCNLFCVVLLVLEMDRF